MSAARALAAPPKPLGIRALNVAGLALEGVEQAAERVAERGLAEIVEAGAPGRGPEERRLVEAGDRQPDRVERAATSSVCSRTGSA